MAIMTVNETSNGVLVRKHKVKTPIGRTGCRRNDKFRWT